MMAKPTIVWPNVADKQACPNERVVEVQGAGTTALVSFTTNETDGLLVVSVTTLDDRVLVYHHGVGIRRCDHGLA